MLMGRYDYDPERVRISRNGRKMWYETKSERWFITCDLRRLDAGRFVSGEANAYFGRGNHDHLDFRISWSMMPDNQGALQIEFHSVRHVPSYVKNICYKLARAMDAKWHPDYGISVVVGSDLYHSLKGGINSE